MINLISNASKFSKRGDEIYVILKEIMKEDQI